jgi:hypothetical protein
MMPAESAMRTIVERVLNTYDPTRTLDQARVAESREKILQYFEKLASAGRIDADRLVEYGIAYLKELHEGPDRRFTGC